MKKIVALALALCMVFAIVAVSASAEEDIGDTLVLYSTMTEKDLEALIDGFAEVYPDCEIEVVSGTIGETTSRIAAEADNPQGDVTWGGLADSDGMQYADLFEEWVSDESANAIEGYSTPNGIYSMDHLSTIVFAINTDLEKELGLDIRSYADLLDPKLEGKIIFSNPNSSSAAWNNLCNIMSVFGPNTDEAWDYIGKLMKNLVISDSSSNCFKLVEQGEYVVGLTYEDGAIKLIQQGADELPGDIIQFLFFGSQLLERDQKRVAPAFVVTYLPVSPSVHTMEAHPPLVFDSAAKFPVNNIFPEIFYGKRGRVRSCGHGRFSVQISGQDPEFRIHVVRSCHIGTAGEHAQVFPACLFVLIILQAVVVFVEGDGSSQKFFPHDAFRRVKLPEAAETAHSVNGVITEYKEPCPCGTK